jgi:hypothetical protein
VRALQDRGDPRREGGVIPHVIPLVHHGDAAEVLPRLVPERSVDFAYLDPPFLTQQVWRGAAGSFSDRWVWGDAAESDLSALAAANRFAADLILALFGETAEAAYYAAMGRLLVATRATLRLTGTLWLHADDTAMAGLRVVGDAVFGPALQLGTVIWRRTSAHSHTGKNFGRVHDTVAVWARSRAARWRLWRLRGEFTHGDPCGVFFVGGFADDRLTPTSKERVGYPTQKPVALIKRFIRNSTFEGDTVLDAVAGSGTTVIAALRAGCIPIAVDRSADAIATIHRRVAAERRAA